MSATKIVAISERHIVLIRELLDRVAPCSTNCEASYAEYDSLRAALRTQPTHKHVERDLPVRMIATVKEVGCDRPLTLFEGACGDHYARAEDEFTNRFAALA